MFGKTNRIHFIGIGGIGMSGMAELLHNLGFVITGSDRLLSERTAYLANMGMAIREGHHSDKLPDCDVVVYSSAVHMDNPEITEALNRKIPVIRRAEMLGELLKLKPVSIGVAGTHGKTTTSSMLGSILTAADLNPTLVIGGIVNSLASNAVSGSGDIIVVEADEYDRTFLSLQSTMAAITNLELEHLDCYENLEDLQSAFAQFANGVPFYGRVALCIDHPNVQMILPRIKRPVITYGFSNQADIQAREMEYNEMSTEFDLIVQRERVSRLSLNVPGAFNVRNALAAVSLALELDVDMEQIKTGLMRYSGVRRRFDIHSITPQDIMLVDDYAHHPSEVKATLQAARTGWDRRIIAVFQPHLYSRTRDFHQDFAQAFMFSDVLIGTEIYPAREEPIPGISGEMICSDAREFGHKQIIFEPDKSKLPERVAETARPGDLVITMGAGDIWRQMKEIRRLLENG